MTGTARVPPAGKASAVLYHVFDCLFLVLQEVLRVLPALPSPLLFQRSRVNRGGILPAFPERQGRREGRAMAPLVGELEVLDEIVVGYVPRL